MKPGVAPIAQFAIGRSQLLRRLCRDQTNDHVRPMAMVELASRRMKRIITQRAVPESGRWMRHAKRATSWRQSR